VNLLPQVTPPPDRVRLKPESRDLDLVMHEYDAIRGEILTTLTNQVSTLSFGAATVGLLVAAAAALWDDAELLSGLLLLFAVPSVCFLTLAIYSGELVRLMRAGLFLNTLENCVNEVKPHHEPVLTWEQWKSIRTRPSDVDRLNRAAIVCVFVLLAVGFMTMGWWRLHTIKQIQPGWLTVFLILSGLAAIVSVVWVGYLNIYAYRHRGHYRYPAEETDTAVLWDAARLANIVGNGYAAQVAANPRQLLAVTVYSPKSLEIHVPGVVETKVGNPESVYRYRYDGLRLLQQSGDRYLLMSKQRDAGMSRIIVLRDNDAIRMEFTR
jgi:hypothetical protein